MTKYEIFISNFFIAITFYDIILKYVFKPSIAYKISSNYSILDYQFDDKYF